MAVKKPTLQALRKKYPEWIISDDYSPTEAQKFIKAKIAGKTYKPKEGPGYIIEPPFKPKNIPEYCPIPHQRTVQSSGSTSGETMFFIAMILFFFGMALFAAAEAHRVLP